MIAFNTTDAATLLNALEDAFEYRTDGGGPDGCGDCTYDELCEDHKNDQELGNLYSALFERFHAPEPTPPAWFQELLDQHGVEVEQLGWFRNTLPIWACMGDCSCWFLVDDAIEIDRYSFVNEAGWCQGQECPCHNLPRRKPGTENNDG